MGLRPISDQMDWAAGALLGAMNSAPGMLFALVGGMAAKARQVGVAWRNRLSALRPRCQCWV